MDFEREDKGRRAFLCRDRSVLSLAPRGPWTSLCDLGYCRLVLPF
jgi:hypothetical protein